jgi:hypothetical protein
VLQAGLIVGDMILAVNKDTLLGSDYDSVSQCSPIILFQHDRQQTTESHNLEFPVAGCLSAEENRGCGLTGSV